MRWPWRTRIVATLVNTSVRPEYDQQFTLARNEGAGITPCMRVLHQVTNAGVLETIDLIDPDDAVRLNVPNGFELSK